MAEKKDVKGIGESSTSKVRISSDINISTNEETLDLLQAALNDEHRKKNGLCVIFTTEQKHPGLKKWQTHAKETQTEEDIKELYNKRGRINTGYSYFTGIGGLIDIDFDWSWLYHEAVTFFGDRFNTRTFMTPNGGYRVLFITESPSDFLEYKGKPPYIEIHGDTTHHVIVHGKARDNKGKLKSYTLVKDMDIKHDANILTDFIKFLKKIDQQCNFLQYPCIKNVLKGKSIQLTQAQRTNIGAFFAAEDIDIERATNFYRCTDDFDYDITKKHLQRLYNKDFKHPTCATLRKNFNAEENDCGKCVRKNKNIFTKTEDEPVFDLTGIDDGKIFWAEETEDGSQYTDVMNETPIFAVGDNVYYIIPLKPVNRAVESKDGKKKHEEKVQGFYGVKAGYGIEPVSFYTANGHAQSKVVSENAGHLINLNQQRTIEKEIKEAIKQSQYVERSPEIIATNIPSYPVTSIHHDIKSRLAYYIKLDFDIQYIAITCFIIGTYLFPLFVNFGYLIVSGEKGSGKGTLLDLLGRMCWNPSKKMISMTESTLFRQIKTQMPTLIIDEYHRAIRNQSSGNALISIIESGYEKDGAVPRSEEYRDENGLKKFKVVYYPVYCPKVLATRHPVEADDKGIKIIIPKIIADEKYSKRRKEITNDTFFEDVRQRLMKWIIQNQPGILDAYKDIEPTKQLNGREYNVWLPILAIGKVAFPHKYRELLTFAEETISKNRSKTYEKEDRVLTALFKLYKDGELNDGGNKLGSPSYLVTNKDISNTLESIEDEGMHHNSIRSSLDNLKLVGYHGTGVYYLKKGKLHDILQERGYPVNLTDDSKLVINTKGPDDVVFEGLKLIQQDILKELKSYGGRTVLDVIEELNMTYKEGQIMKELNDMVRNDLILIELNHGGY